MPPGTRLNSDKGDDSASIINFLKSPEFSDIIKTIVSKIVIKETKSLYDKINQLELKIGLMEKTKNKSEVIHSKSVNVIDSNSEIITKSHDVRSTDRFFSNVIKRPAIQKTTDKKVDVTTDKIDMRDKSENANIQSATKLNGNADINSEQQWKIATRRRNKIPIIYGSSNENDTIKAATKYVHYHVFRLQPDLTCDRLETYLKSKKIEDVKCMKISSKHPDEYSSFKVTVPARLDDLIKDPTTWPQDVCINRFLSRLLKENTIKK